MLKEIRHKNENGIDFVQLENRKWYALDAREWNGEYYSSYEVGDGSYYGYVEGSECEVHPVYKWDAETDTGEIIGYEVD